MRVLGIQNHNNTYYQPSCKSIHTTMRNGAGEIIHSNTTCIYRNDMQWHKLISHIIDKYKNVDKVNIYDYACSNGSEAYTILMELIEQCKNLSGVSVSKFCPVIAKDNMPKILKDAESRKMLLSRGEIKYVDKVAESHPDKSGKYFYRLNESFFNINSPEPMQHYYYVRDILRNKVEYSNADILKDYKKIEPDNSVIFFRNVWPYLKEEDRLSLAKNLYEHMGDNSMLVTGDYDNQEVNLSQLLKDVGFKENPDIKNVFSKK